MKANLNASFVIFIIILLVAFMTSPLYGEEPLEVKVLVEGADITSSVSLDLWHYSGGYWKVGNSGFEKITIEDEEMRDRGYDSILSDELAEFSVPLPTKVQSLIAEGKDVVATVVARFTPIEELFESDTIQLDIISNVLYFNAKPKFNLIHFNDLSFSDYGLSLSGEIPLIDRAYGYNIYSLFGNGEAGAQSAGRINRNSPEVVEEGYVHPSMITGLNGALEGGHTIYIRGSAEDSAGYTVGQGTFAAGGAVGLSFSYPVKFQFYEVVDALITPPAITGPAIVEASVDVVLNLPPKTYEGHPVFAVDASIFEVEGEEISAVRAYEENLADNSFRIVENGVGNLSRRSNTQAEAVFFGAGNYNVRLTVNTQSGETGEDVKPITVVRTPAILHSLSGTQKQNRKQSLSVSVAQNPSFPIVEVWMELEDSQSGEKVHLVDQLAGGQNVLQNSELIKTRPIQQAGSTQYFVNLRLDFLTKNTENQDFIYRIFAKDSRGYTDYVEVLFPVAKDNPPEAAIDLAPSFLRNKGSNIAEITTGDVSQTDGDQLDRTWYYWTASQAAIDIKNLAGYRDISFGTGKTVRFNKEGVGIFSVRLEVQDVWTEETLLEYIMPSDYLKAEATSSSVVDNVAPTVSLKAIQTQTAEILILAKDQLSYGEALAGQRELFRLLLAEGIDARIHVKHISAAGNTQGGLIENTGKLTVPYGFQGTWSGFWENGSFTSDESQIYKAEATWSIGASDYECYPSQPYTIRAYDADTLNQIWVYTLPAEHFSMGADLGSSAFFGHDSQGLFLYFIINGQTILLDKKTGAELAVLPYVMSANNSVSGDNIFCFKTDGIYRISRTDGSIRKILSENILGNTRSIQHLGGKEVFLVRRGTELFRAAFDTNSQTLNLCRLQGTSQDSGVAVTYLVGIDSFGTLVTNTVEGTLAKVRAFDETGKLLYQSTSTVVANFPDCVVPIYDSSGRINYIGIRTYSRSGSNRYVSVTLRGIYNGYAGTVSVKHTEGYPTEADRLLFAVEKDTGNVLVGLGAQWTYIADSGYNNGPVHGLPERAKVFSFNPAAGTAAEGALSNLSAGLNSVLEYGYYSPGILLLSTGANHQVASAAYHSTSVLNVSETEEGQINRFKARHLSYSSDYTLCKEISGSFSARTIADEFLLQKEQGENTLLLTTATSTGSISKGFELKPGKTYHYEYKTTAEEDILFARTRFTQIGAASIAGSNSYKVRDEFFEDFNDTELDPYFDLDASRVDSGKYTAARVYLSQGSNWKNKYLASSSTVEFTVPENIKGILSFDFDILMDSGWMANFFTLSKDDGTAVAWDEFIPGSTTGKYTHKKLLEPGHYTLTAYARAYGGRIMDYHTKIDNLRIFLVEARSDTSLFEEHKALETVSQVRSEGSMNLITGSFTAPSSVEAYAKLDAEYIEDGPSTAYSSVSGQTGRYTMNINIPVARTALYLGVDIWSSPTITSGDNYNNVTFTRGSQQWSCAYNNRYPQSALSNIPRNYRLAFRGLTGVQTIDQRSSTHRNATGGFSGVQAVLSNPGVSVPQEVLAGQFFMADSALFFESTTTTGDTEITLMPNKIGETQIQELKIYTIENGTRVYIEDTSFRREAVLQQWDTKESGVAIVACNAQEEEAAAMVYPKGEFISYQIFYEDYENDPSKISYWKYTHTPMNDGAYPLNGQVLTEPINRFYVDGKYVLEHWQEDDAARSGCSPYDRPSNVCALTFYIEGTVQAPWITFIRTDPTNVEVGEDYAVYIGVDDKEKDTLQLTTELYHQNDPEKPIYLHVQNGLEADVFGRYPTTEIPIPYKGIAGRYDIVAIVRDETGAGLGTYRFYCLAPMNIKGEVSHTKEWEKNRKVFNLERFGTENNTPVDFAVYSALSSPRLRGSNVFWPGELLCLDAKVSGNPLSVSATMAGRPESKILLKKSAEANALGEVSYEGTLRAAETRAQAGAASAELQTVIFKAQYTGGAELIHSVDIILDRDIGYWQLHRLY